VSFVQPACRKRHSCMRSQQHLALIHTLIHRTPSDASNTSRVLTACAH
jgi:hypothetical protein